MGRVISVWYTARSEDEGVRRLERRPGKVVGEIEARGFRPSSISRVPGNR